MEECNQGWWDKWMMADYCWSIKSDLKTMNMTDNQERENFYDSSYVHKGFISAVSL